MSKHATTGLLPPAGWSAVNLPAWCLTVVMLVVTGAVMVVAPTDLMMGPAQRILYVHVSVAWVSLLAFCVMAATGVRYLCTRDLKWDAWSGAAAELGWLCCSLTLVSGSLWAHEAWGTWWTWDPRLTTAFILWLLYGACLTVRRQLLDAHDRARIGAVLAAIGLLDVPLVAMATRWFRGIHPVAPQMEPAMRAVLAITAGCFSILFVTLLLRRQQQLRRESEWRLDRRRT